MKSLVCLVSVLTIAGMMNAATITNFDDLSLPEKSSWSGNYTVDGVDGNYDTAYFQSGSSTFENHSDAEWASWGGFAYSNEVDTTTAGYGNQFSAYPGQAHSGNNFAIGFQDTYNGYNPTAIFDVSVQVSGLYVTNTTYTALAMLNGEGPATAFGQDDWFKLTITGKDAADQITGFVDFDLASGRDIVNSWEYVDVTGLGVVKSLEFTLTSSDNGAYGMNTPAFFALDTIVPEPATITLLGLGAFVLRKKES
jgi:hypothetical protein